MHRFKRMKCTLSQKRTSIGEKNVGLRDVTSKFNEVMKPPVLYCRLSLYYFGLSEDGPAKLKATSTEGRKNTDAIFVELQASVFFQLFHIRNPALAISTISRSQFIIVEE